MEPAIARLPAVVEGVERIAVPSEARVAQRAACQLRGDVQAIVIGMTALERRRVHRVTLERREQLRERGADLRGATPHFLVERVQRDEALHLDAELCTGIAALAVASGAQCDCLVADNARGNTLGHVDDDDVLLEQHGRAAEHLVIGMRRKHRDPAHPWSRAASLRPRSATYSSSSSTDE